MSKKKAVNTMTLKDFHGGSIPSDLPLPSAPGVVVRPSSDHRQSAWGNRSENRVLRPSSSGSMRSNLDDRTPFLSTNVNIGRCFDEDERTPLDGGPVTRRIIGDYDFRRPVMHIEERGNLRRGSSREGLGLGVGIGGGSYSARVVEGGNVGSGGVTTSAWGVRKETVGMNEAVSNPWVGGQSSTVSKFAQASALDQISSGRWHTRSVPHQVDIEVIRQPDSPSDLYGRESEFYDGVVGAGSDREIHENMLVRHVERVPLVEDGVRGSVIGVEERVRSLGVYDGKGRSSVLFTNEGLPAYVDGKNGSSGLLVGLEEKVSERPKLKLLPRTRPLEVTQSSIVDYKQQPDNAFKGFQPPFNVMKGIQHINGDHPEVGEKSHANGSHVRPGLTSREVGLLKPVLNSGDVGNQVLERPKLNLKPRSQPVNKLDSRTERERITLFGGARPREAVLKERGVDDVVVSHDETQGPRRMRNDVACTEVAPVHTNASRRAEKLPNHSIDHKTGQSHEKKDQRAGAQKSELQGKNWRNENWRSSGESEKPHRQERPPSLDTWRKPVEQPKADNPGLRFGKALSAVELVQAFSRPVSDPKQVEPFFGQRGLPGRTYSRLTGSATRPQINGY